jgi:hypothetical protein
MEVEEQSYKTLTDQALNYLLAGGLITTGMTDKQCAHGGPFGVGPRSR